MLPDPGKAQANRFNLARRLSYAVIPYPRDRCPDQRGGTLAAQADTGCHDAGGRARLDQAYGQTILSNYEDYDKLKKRIENGVAPTEAMDLSALFFLLFPYDAATGQPLGFPVTAMMYFARYCGQNRGTVRGIAAYPGDPKQRDPR